MAELRIEFLIKASYIMVISGITFDRSSIDDHRDTIYVVWLVYFFRMYMIELIQTKGADYLEGVSYKYEKVTYNCTSSMYTLMHGNV